MASANNPLLFIVSEPVGSPAANEIAYRLADHGVRTWIGSLAPSGELKDEAVEALRASAAALLVFDQAAARSEHVDRHLLVARQMGKPIIPLRVQQSDEGLLRHALVDARWVEGSAPEAAIAEISRRAFDYDRARREPAESAGFGAGAGAGGFGAGAGVAAAGLAGGAAAAGANPRIQVIRGGAGDTMPSPGRPRIEVAGAAPRAPAGGPAAEHHRPPPMPESAPYAAPAPARRGRSATMLLATLALIAVVAAVLYTAFQTRGGDADDERIVAERSDTADYTVAPREEVGSAPAEAPLPEEQPMAQQPDEAPLPSPDPASAAAEQPDAAPPAAPAQAQPQPEEPETAEAPAPSAAPAAAAAGGAAATVQAFYSALSRGDGAAAAQHVIPSKRGSGPLSGASLGRYYSSFRRPLRVRSLTPVDGNTVRVSYDYVLGDGRLCRGAATVNVAGGLVSSINTQGPC